MRRFRCLLILILPLALGGRVAFGQGTSPVTSKRVVLVELFTSQGCDMCPTAEQYLGELAEKNRGIVPIAFHVDYFNTPWKDVFSDPLYSQRQLNYDQVYTKPKDAKLGLYYTPMLMIDGEQMVNGRDPATAQLAIHQALAKKLGVGIDLALEVKDDGLSGTAMIKGTSRSPRTEKAPLLLCAVLREDGVVTDIRSGENRGKSLVARFPARQAKYEFIELDGKTPATQQFSFDVDPTWKREKLRLAVFVQDKGTGSVHQALDSPWRSTTAAEKAATSKAKVPPREH